MFKGMKVTYEAPKRAGVDKPAVPVINTGGGSSKKIWFPDGAPVYTADTEAADPSMYDEKTMAQWNAFLQTGRFANGIMPEVAPKREWCAWDF
jgi:nucleoporin NUP42